MKKKKIKRTSHKSQSALDNALKSTLFSLAVTIAISLAMLLLCTGIALATPDPTALVEPIGYVTPFVTAFLGGFACSKLNKSAPYPSSLLTGAGFVLLSMFLSFALPHSLASGLNIFSRLALHALSFLLFPLGTLIGVKASRTSHTLKRKKRR